MKIIEQSSDIVGVCPSPIDENMKRIELVGRACYQSQDKVTDTSYISFCDMLFRNQHGAMLEHSNAVFSVKSHSGHFTPLGIQLRIILTSKFLRTYYVDGVPYIGGNYRAWAEQIELDHLDNKQSIPKLIWRVKEWFSDYGIGVQHTPTEEIPKELHRITVRFKTNRAMTHEIVRHRDDCSFGQLSQRYVRHVGDIEFIKPVNITEKEFMSVFEKSCEESEKKYQELLKSFSPQQARNVLTNAVATEIYVTTNAEEWNHIFRLRCAKSADPQMQALMCPVRDEFQKLGFI